jgi:hypothetical protein
MIPKKRFFLLLLAVCLTQSGCELLSLPGDIISGLFGLAGAATLPLPAPWMFF